MVNEMFLDLGFVFIFYFVFWLLRVGVTTADHVASRWQTGARPYPEDEPMFCMCVYLGLHDRPPSSFIQACDWKSRTHMLVHLR